MTWAARIVPACQDLADRLTAAGVPATVDRRRLEVPGAWVTPETARPLTLAGTGRCRVSVLLVAPMGGDLEALGVLAGLLEKTLTVVRPDDEVDTAVLFPHNNNPHPAFRLPVDLTL